jgi:hypothetical protein
MKPSSTPLNEMLSYLVLDQYMTKNELARIIRASIAQINQEAFNNKQHSRIEKIYWRMKDYEDQWSLYHNASGECLHSAS